MNAEKPITYDLLVDDLSTRINKLKIQLAETEAALATIKENPAVVPIIDRLTRPMRYYE